MKAFEESLLNTSTEGAHCLILPPDQQWIPNFGVSHIIISTLEGLIIKLPCPTGNIAIILRKYHAAINDVQCSRRKWGAF
jgi:hypothetical protein